MHNLQSLNLLYTQGTKHLTLREVNGWDELGVGEISSVSAIMLINRLIQPKKSGVILAEHLVTADRDQILAAIYINLFGSRVNGRSKCKDCGESFEINFQLSQLQQHIQEGAVAIAGEDGKYFMDTYGFRLPTGEDELAVASLPPDKAVHELLRLCVIKSEEGDGDKIQDAMARIAPVLQTEIKTNCPECGATQNARFDIQSYLLAKLREEQKILFRDVHCIASAYKWGHREIMELPRTLRKKYVSMLQDEYNNY